MKRAVLLGASGSIGKQVIDIVDKQDEIKIVAIAVGDNIAFMREYLNSHKVEHAYSKKRDEDLIAHYHDVCFYDGDDGILKMLEQVDYDILINALVGFVGFMPTYKAISDGKDVALANKESLVVGGDLIKAMMKKTNAKLYPIDSEHSAIYQVIKGSSRSEIKRLIITASGGAFRDKRRDELKDVRKEDALKHPTWTMGAKITIDSATMMNKGFEIIEAHHLFDVDYDKIDVLIHKESIVHSLVEFEDDSTLAQLSEPDMRLPISYALFDKHKGYPTSRPLDLTKYGALHFEKMDERRFPLVKIAKMVGEYGGNLGAYLNGANDTAVDLFLKGEISFLMIEELIIKTIREAKYKKEVTISDIEEAYDDARSIVLKTVDEDFR